MLRTHPLYSQTICLKCVPKLGITGCSYRDGDPVEFIFGTAPPPRGWKGRRTSNSEILEKLSSAAFVLPPRPKPIEPFNVRDLLPQLLGG